MKKITEFNSQSLRRERNADLLRQMQNGEQMASFNSYASWFPPRPIIQKDSSAIHKLYGDTVSELQPFPSDARDSVPNMGDLQPLRLA